MCQRCAFFLKDRVTYKRQCDLKKTAKPIKDMLTSKKTI